MTREELLKANEQLLARRKREGIGQPKPIETAAQAIAEKDGMTLTDYFNALHAGTYHSENAARLDTSRAKWESFNSDRHPSLKKAMPIIKRWYGERLDKGNGLILAGNYGCGKTHLAQAIYDLYGFGAMYVSEVELAKQIQAGYGGSGGRSLESFVSQAKRAKLLIYDDLGAYETDNLNWVQNIYMNLFDGRFEQGKAILITTNLKLIEGEANAFWSPLEQRLGGRVYSRIMGQLEEAAYYVSLFDVPDYRMRGF